MQGMQNSANSKIMPGRKRRLSLSNSQKGIAMKFLILLLTVTSLQVLAEDFKETITISKKNASLKEIFRMVQKQSDYSFAYTDPMLSRARPVDIDVKNAGIEQVLSICFR